jgi:hypothetical protein
MDAHAGRFPDPDILALLERADAAMRRGREVIANMDALARVIADAVQRSDEWLAAAKAGQATYTDHIRSIRADAQRSLKSMAG